MATVFYVIQCLSLAAMSNLRFRLCVIDRPLLLSESGLFLILAAKQPHDFLVTKQVWLAAKSTCGIPQFDTHLPRVEFHCYFRE